VLPESITDTHEYDAFGNMIGSAGTTPNNYLYRGEQYDPDRGCQRSLRTDPFSIT